jgi:hypothetical protein
MVGSRAAFQGTLGGLRPRRLRVLAELLPPAHASTRCHPAEWRRLNGDQLAACQAQRRLPVCPSEYLPGCGHTVRPCGSLPTLILVTAPLYVSIR